MVQNFSTLKPPNDNVLFPHWEAHMFYDFSTSDDQELLVNEILGHK